MQTNEVIVWSKTSTKIMALKANKVVKQFGFIVHQHEKCNYFNNFDNGYIILCLYVDILILGTSFDAI